MHVKIYPVNPDMIKTGIQNIHKNNIPKQFQIVSLMNSNSLFQTKYKINFNSK